MKREVKIIKNRSDIGAGTRGSDMGIDAIEVAAITAADKYFTRFPYLDVKTHNETIYNKVNALFAKRITHVREQCQRVSNAVKTTLDKGQFPIVLSGDHSSALGTISGIKSHDPGQRLGIVWIDAHADLHSPYTSPSGNVHGMPLAAALGEDNLPSQINAIDDQTQREWSNLKNLDCPGPKIRPEDLMFFGVRDTEAPEEDLMRRLGIRNYPVYETRYRGLRKCTSEVVEALVDCDQIYISFDVDSMDCHLVSQGTGTPVPKGFDPEEVFHLISDLAQTGKVACLEIAEVNPLLDRQGNRMAETAFNILSRVTPLLQSSKNGAPYHHQSK